MIGFQQCPAERKRVEEGFLALVIVCFRHSKRYQVSKTALDVCSNDIRVGKAATNYGCFFFVKKNWMKI